MTHVEATSNGELVSIEFIGAVDSFRPIGPTRPPHTRGHPWFPAHDVGDMIPSKFSSFCEAGCNFFFSEFPSNTTCKRRCDRMYRYDVEGGYSDLAEVARYECYDGCDIAILRCQPGYRCDWPTTTGVPAESNWELIASMTQCGAGNYRDVDSLKSPSVTIVHLEDLGVMVEGGVWKPVRSVQNQDMSTNQQRVGLKIV
eukprot:CAMPEP_0114396342 /NCGR_PEP_ID=MMETSP0102-20121206/13509_1 /TAXON_ID=38822 ORGANISM="Pteridomonas danica, Strain PT" /NCGR_SAMPLE_ID=MMETSP0102 /ASSEMBLY_ACC=CAM_ASM_000212 /LENGTH=198 /DNA_ID=CAMNT_0001557039 /DNA_START=76 /DNA_END=673 /DNA_ORIENTATION=+